MRRKNGLYTVGEIFEWKIVRGPVPEKIQMVKSRSINVGWKMVIVREDLYTEPSPFIDTLISIVK